MPAPVTSVLDNFNRTENPLSNAGAWTNKIVSTHLNVQANGTAALGTGTTAHNSAWWNATQYGDAEAFCTLSTLPASTQFAGVALALTNVGLSTGSGYFGYYIPGTGVRISRGASGTLTTLGTTAVTLAAGDKLNLRRTGSTLVLATFSSGAWTDRVTVTDTTFGVGYLGILGSGDATWQLDDFGGGAVANVGQRVSQVAVEAAVRNAGAKARVSHVAVETALVNAAANVRVSQIAVEVVRSVGSGSSGATPPGYFDAIWEW